MACWNHGYSCHTEARYQTYHGKVEGHIFLPVSFCTNSMALPLAYQVNGGNKFIIVFWCLYLSLGPYIQVIKKTPLHVKENTGVTLMT